VHPLRFGVVIERFPSPAQVLETARRAEAAGYAGLLIRDHYIAEPFGRQYAPLATLAAVSQVTRTLRLGGLVFNVDYRHPAELAKAVATVDQLSGGRVEVALGAGFSRQEYAATGQRYDPNSVRVDRFEEAVQVLGELLRGGPVSHAGAHYRLQDYANFPACVQRPRPPIMVGAGGPRMLSIAARHADGVHLLPEPIAAGVFADPSGARRAANVKRQVASLREAAPERFHQLELCLIATEVVATSDRRATAEEVIRRRNWSDVTVDDVLAMPSVLIGSIEEMAHQLHATRDELGVSYLVVPDRLLADLAPVVERVAGA
jgi:probable F420-dependent oxidoreductase